MNGGKGLKIGQLLLRETLITEHEFKKALLIQKNQKIYKPFGEICVEKKFLTKADFQRVLRKYDKQIKLGELLINLDLVEPDQLKDALRSQKARGGKVGEILVRQGSLTETSLVNVLSKQLDVPKIIPSIHQIDSKLLKGIGEEFLMKNEVLPAFRGDDCLTAIMSNPLDTAVIRNLSRTLQCKIKPAIAASGDIRDTIRKVFRQLSLDKNHTGKDELNF